MIPIKTISLAIFIIIADQLSKWAVMEYILRPLNSADSATRSLIEWIADAPDRLPYVSTQILPFFNFVVVWNQGVSFGMLRNDSNYGPYLLIALSFAIVIGFLIWMFRTHNRVHHFCIALVIGGAIGNVIDRFRFGAVFDFLDFHVLGFHWPAFNIADSAIVVGVFVLMLYAFLFERKHH